MATTDRIQLEDIARTITDRLGNPLVLGSGIEDQAVDLSGQTAELVAAGAAVTTTVYDSDSTSELIMYNVSTGTIGTDYTMAAASTFGTAGDELWESLLDTDVSASLTADNGAIHSVPFNLDAAVVFTSGGETSLSARVRWVGLSGATSAGASEASGSLSATASMVNNFVTLDEGESLFSLDAAANLSTSGGIIIATSFDADAAASITIEGTNADAINAGDFDLDAAALAELAGGSIVSASHTMAATGSLTVAPEELVSVNFDMDAAASLTTAAIELTSAVFDSDATASLASSGAATNSGDLVSAATASATYEGASEASSESALNSDAAASLTVAAASEASGTFDANATASNTFDGTGIERVEASFDIAIDTYFNAWDVDFASYSDVALGVASQDGSPSGVFFKPDGTKLYVTGVVGQHVIPYTLSTAWDVSTATYDGASFSVASQETSPQGLFFKPDGTKMYVIGIDSASVNSYTLSTAWDVTSATYDGASASFSVSALETSPRGVFIKADGTKMYVVGFSSVSAIPYTLSTAWDVSSASYDGTSFDLSSEDTIIQGVTFKPDGTKMYITGSSTDSIIPYTLATAWDVTSASYDGTSFSVASQDTSPTGVAFKPDGSYMYVSGFNSDAISQYSVGNASIRFVGENKPMEAAIESTAAASLTADSESTTTSDLDSNATASLTSEGEATSESTLDSNAAASVTVEGEDATPPAATLYLTSSVSGDVTTPANALGAPDDTTTADGNTSNSWTHRWSFGAAPSGTYNANQTFTIRLRKGSNSGDPTVGAITIYRNGSSIGTLSSILVTSTSLIDVDRILSDGSSITAGDTIDIEMSVSAAGGSPSTRNSVEIDSVTWVPSVS